ncbi:MAG: hypothetical protein RLZZ502_502, partial [Pseudomonadota bacterium]|jgi:PhzF family phenazine biosynthesis protein
MRVRRFVQVDVFTAVPYLGNALAVVLDAEGLSEAQMQGFARWTNLSETTFILPPTAPQADYRVRIFTPNGELPFAGHPTLGTCHAWLAAGGRPKAALIRQECAVGLVDIAKREGRLAFAAPALKQTPVQADHLAVIVQALGLSPTQVLAHQSLNNGPLWHALLLDSAATVLALRPDMALLKQAGLHVGVLGQHKARHAAAGIEVEVRAFAPGIGVDEDPVTGSLNASLAQWLMAAGHLPGQYLARQGAVLKRAGEVYLLKDGEDEGRVWVGGHCVTCIEGSALI